MVGTWDWREFCDRHSIPYVEQSSNVARNNINIKCPFCGLADKSEHMGLSLLGSDWGCWRDKTHRGRSPIGLVAMLLRIPKSAAAALVDEGKAPAPVEDLKNRLMAITTKTQHERFEAEYLSRPSSARPITQAPPRYRNYMARRGYAGDALLAVQERHGLLAYQSRILFPLRPKIGQVVGWYGRAIDKRTKPRYLAHPDGEVVKRYLWNQDNARGGQALFVVEGQFDALKIDLLGHEVGVHAVSCQTTSITDAQRAVLAKIGSFYEKIVVMFDPGAYQQAEQVRQELIGLPVVAQPTPPGVEDLGAMPPEQINRLIKGVL